MKVAEVVALVVGGGVGAGARYVVDGLVMRGRREAFPLGILVVNVSGSFLLGVLTALGPVIGHAWLTILGLGLLGGFTTFSTVAVDSVRLARRGRRDWAWADIVGTLVACVVAAAVGFMIGGLFPR